MGLKSAKFSVNSSCSFLLFCFKMVKQQNTCVCLSLLDYIILPSKKKVPLYEWKYIILVSVEMFTIWSSVWSVCLTSSFSPYIASKAAFQVPWVLRRQSRECFIHHLCIVVGSARILYFPPLILMLFTDTVELFGLRSALGYIGSSHLDSTKKEIAFFFFYLDIWCNIFVLV